MKAVFPTPLISANNNRIYIVFVQVCEKTYRILLTDSPRVIMNQFTVVNIPDIERIIFSNMVNNITRILNIPIDKYTHEYIKTIPYITEDERFYGSIIYEFVNGTSMSYYAPTTDAEVSRIIEAMSVIIMMRTYASMFTADCISVISQSINRRFELIDKEFNSLDIAKIINNTYHIFVEDDIIDITGTSLLGRIPGSRSNANTVYYSTDKKNHELTMTEVMQSAIKESALKMEKKRAVLDAIKDFDIYTEKVSWETRSLPGDGQYYQDTEVSCSGYESI